MAYTYDERIVSDLHKDAYGFRPRELFWLNWESSNQDEKQLIWDGLLQALDAEIQREREEHDLAQAAWEADLQRLIAVGAGDRATAIRWDMDAMGVRRGDQLDVGFYCYLRGIDYSNEIEIERLMAA
jgi:hypothetical protein